nr:hypothetical protein CFP56_57723 [Quercus suber]
MEVADCVGARPHEDCDPNSPRTDVGPSGEVHETVQEIVHEGTYDLWVMVARRKNGTKTHRSRRSPLGQKNVMTRNFNDNFDMKGVDKQGVGRAEITNGSMREKLNDSRFLPTRPVSIQNSLKSNSVKGKKGIVRLRASPLGLISAAEEGKAKLVSVEHLKGNAVLALKEGKPCDGDSRPGASGNFQFTATTWPEMGYKFRGGDNEIPKVVLAEIRANPTQIMG